MHKFDSSASLVFYFRKLKSLCRNDVVKCFKQYAEQLQELGENQSRMERKIEELIRSTPLRRKPRTSWSVF